MHKFRHTHRSAVILASLEATMSSALRRVVRR